MARDRRNQIVLAALAVVLAGAAYRAWSTSYAEPASSSSTTSGAGGRAGSKAGGGAAPDVHLKDLDGNRPKPLEAARDLFRFKPKPLPPPAASRLGSAPVVPSGPPQPPPPPPIALKFIGVVERPEKAERIAVLRDVAGHLLSGHEGAIIDGRFRILRIGVESIEMAYLDGRGRQTIRLSGG